MRAMTRAACSGGTFRYAVSTTAARVQRLSCFCAHGVAAEEPPDLQVNAHFLAAAGGIGHLPPVAAVHPPRHLTVPCAGCLAVAGPGQHMHRPARRRHPLDGHVGQVRKTRTVTA